MPQKKRFVKHNDQSLLKNCFISLDVEGKLPPRAKERDMIKYLISQGDDLEGLDRRQRRIAKRILK